MSPVTYALGIVGSALTLIVVLELLRRRKLKERHAIWWLVAGLLALVIAVFPGVLEWAAGLVGIALPTNLIFFTSIAVLFLVCIQHAVELTRAERQSRRLAERLALLEVRITALEQDRPGRADR